MASEVSTTPKVVILTGAGISAESGLGTFRDKDGIWTQYDLEDVATPQGFARDPHLVHEFYNARRRGLLDAAVNAAHRALARLEAATPGEILIVTQNIDDLHERAGSRSVLHMHGELLNALCDHCGARRPWREDLSTALACEACGRAGGMRPDVVWFGEMPYYMEEIGAALAQAELFVSIGTSGNVYPAAGFVEEARMMGLDTLELNLEPTSPAFAHCRSGVATEVVPAWVEERLARR